MGFNSCPCGKEFCCYRNDMDGSHIVPDYFNDYNAVVEVEKSLKGKQVQQYAHLILDRLAYDDDFYISRKEHGDRIYHLNSYSMGDILRTPLDIKIDALGKTLGLWE